VLRMRNFSHEYLQHFVTLESRLWRTLWTLLTRPSMLTVEFLAGRRRRYVRPLPLYQSLSFVVFLLMSLMPSAPLLVIDDNKAITTQQADKPGDGLPELRIVKNELKDLPEWAKPLIPIYYESMRQWNVDPEGQAKRILPIFQSRIPYAVFFLVPLFALNSRILYFRRRRFYAEHFLLALHLHAFAFLTLSLALLASRNSFGPLLFLICVGYTAIALRTTFGGRWWPQILRALTLLFSHFILLVIVLGLTLALTLPAT